MEMTVQQAAALARLRLSAEEQTRAEAEFREILRFARAMGGAADMAADAPVQGTVRSDEPCPCLDREDILRLAPAHDAGCIAVPKAIE